MLHNLFLRITFLSNTLLVDTAPIKNLKLLAIRAIDPPSRHTPPGISIAVNSQSGEAVQDAEVAFASRELAAAGAGVWRPSRGGMKRDVLKSVIRAVLERGGVTEEAMAALVNVES